MLNMVVNQIQKLHFGCGCKLKHLAESVERVLTSKVSVQIRSALEGRRLTFWAALQSVAGFWLLVRFCIKLRSGRGVEDGW